MTGVKRAEHLRVSNRELPQQQEGIWVFGVHHQFVVGKELFVVAGELYVEHWPSSPAAGVLSGIQPKCHGPGNRARAKTAREERQYVVEMWNPVDQSDGAQRVWRLEPAFGPVSADGRVLLYCESALNGDANRRWSIRRRSVIQHDHDSNRDGRSGRRASANRPALHGGPHRPGAICLEPRGRHHDRSRPTEAAIGGAGRIRPMSLPPNFYDAFRETGAIARKRSLMSLAALAAETWYPVIEAPIALGERIRAELGYVWLLVGRIPAHVSAHLLEIEEAPGSELMKPRAGAAP